VLLAAALRIPQPATLRVAQPQIAMSASRYGDLFDLRPTGLMSTFGAIGGASCATGIGILISHDAPAAAPSPVLGDTFGTFVFACAVTFAFLYYGRQGALENKILGLDEACLVQEEDHVCGPISFDSTDDGMVCVEVWEAGKLRWACS